MKNYQHDARMAALQSFIFNLEWDETCADILSNVKCVILFFKKGKHLYIMFRLRYFTIVCNMGQDTGLGQLYNVHKK